MMECIMKYRVHPLVVRPNDAKGRGTSKHTFIVTPIVIPFPAIISVGFDVNSDSPITCKILELLHSAGRLTYYGG
jgi:hypothetical protein